MITTSTRQKAICREHGVEFCAVKDSDKLGFAILTSQGSGPWHGLRHTPVIGTTGWFVWKGEYKETANFFAPLHTKHISDLASAVTDFLGLAPGWRFLIDGNYSDVWFDESLLNLGKVKATNS